MSKLIDQALVQFITTGRLGEQTAMQIVDLCQRYEEALKHIAKQPEPLPKKIALEALENTGDL